MMSLAQTPVIPADHQRESVAPIVARYWWTLLALAAIVCHMGIAWSARSPGILTGQDDAEYVLLARALMEGSYRELWRVDAPIHAQYPPGYPALLALWGSLWGTSYDSLVLLSTFASGGTLLLVYAGLGRLFGPPIAAATVAVLAANPYLVLYGGTIASEGPFTFCTALGLYCLIRAESASSEALGRSSNAWLAAAGTAALLGSMTRAAGVALIAAVWLWMILHRRWRPAAIYAVIAAGVKGGWLLWSILAPEQFTGRSYIADIREEVSGGIVSTLLIRIASNAWDYAAGSLQFVVAFPTVPNTLIDNITGLVVVSATLLAGFLVFTRRWMGAALYLLGYAAVLLLFRWTLTRFLVPLLIVLVPAMLVGGVALVDRVRPAWRNGALLALTLLFIWGGGVRSSAFVAASCPERGELPPAPCITPAQAGYFDALRFVRTSLPPGATLLTAKSGALFYYTGRTSISVEGARAQHPDDFLEWVRGQGADYILLGSMDGIEKKYFSAQLHANCGRLALVRSFPARTLLFDISPSAPAAETAGNACDALADYRAWSASELESDGDSE